MDIKCKLLKSDVILKDRAHSDMFSLRKYKKQNTL